SAFTALNWKKDLQICGAGRTSRTRLRLVVGKKPNGKFRIKRKDDMKTRYTESWTSRAQAKSSKGHDSPRIHARMSRTFSLVQCGISLFFGAITLLGVASASGRIYTNRWTGSPGNWTDQVANDYEVWLIPPISTTTNYEICGVYSSATNKTGRTNFVQFPTNTISGNWESNVVITWSGTNVNPKGVIHIGVCIIGPTNVFGLPHPLGWTTNGQRLYSKTAFGVSAAFTGEDSSDWVVVKVQEFDDTNGTDLVGTEWFEGLGTNAVISNQNSPNPIYAQWSLNTPSPDQIALEDLDESLGGFAPFGPIVELPPAVLPAFSSISMLSGTNLTVSGGNGWPSVTYYLVTSTNLTTPPMNWTVVQTSSFDLGGNFTNIVSLDTNVSQQFYQLMTY
ncbi:MAG: hypothetical protein WBN22_12870, partial [Verrucomicrobiia bacterium]